MTIVIFIKRPAGWTSMNFHFTADGSQWTDPPGVALDPNPPDSRWLRTRFPGWDGWYVACVEASTLTFCLADDSEPRRWDNNGGHDFVVAESGVWDLHDGKLTRIDVGGAAEPVAAIVGETYADGILAPWPAPGPLTNENAGLAVIDIAPAPALTDFCEQPVDGPGIFRLAGAVQSTVAASAGAPLSTPPPTELLPPPPTEPSPPPPTEPSPPPSDYARAKEALIKKLRGRGFQKHGTPDYPQCHRIPHKVLENIIAEHRDKLTMQQLEELRFIEEDTRRGPRKDNQMHLNLERELRESVLRPDSKLSYPARQRALIMIGRVEIAYRKGNVVDPTVIRLVLDEIGKATRSDGLSVLQSFVEEVDLRTVDNDFRRVHLVPAVNRNVDNVARAVATSPVRADGVLKKSSTAVRKGHVTFKSDGTVDKRCAGYRRGLVDDDGRPVRTTPTRPSPSTTSSAADTDVVRVNLASAFDAVQHPVSAPSMPTLSPAPTVTAKFYSGGQFLPGGGRAPAASGASLLRQRRQ